MGRWRRPTRGPEHCPGGAVLDRQLQSHLDELAAVDRATAVVLAQAADTMGMMARLAAEDGWLGTASDPQVTALLGR